MLLKINRFALGVFCPFFITLLMLVRAGVNNLEPSGSEIYARKVQ